MIISSYQDFISTLLRTFENHQDFEKSSNRKRSDCHIIYTLSLYQSTHFNPFFFTRTLFSGISPIISSICWFRLFKVYSTLTWYNPLFSKRSIILSPFFLSSLYFPSTSFLYLSFFSLLNSLYFKWSLWFYFYFQYLSTNSLFFIIIIIIIISINTSLFYLYEILSTNWRINPRSSDFRNIRETEGVSFFGLLF